MTAPLDMDSILDTIATLAMDIARQCPECADHASRIATLAAQVRGTGLDRGVIQDALDTRMAETELSDLGVRSAAEAVVKATRTEN